MILLVDNYDSFTYNLAQFASEYSEIVVKRNDAADLEATAQKAQAIIFSPGPGYPKNAGRMEDLIRRYVGKKPMLGICLGHQAIGEVFGARVVLAKKIRHGKVSLMRQTKQNKIFAGLPKEIPVMRYHSLILEQDTLPDCLEVLGISKDDDEIMAVKHKDHFIYGLQFHPESIGTPAGKEIIKNFIQLVQLESEEQKYVHITK